MRIIVIDDEPSMVDLIGRACQAGGNEVQTYTSSAKAMAALGTMPVDLLITDLIMPAPDGLAILRELRRLHPHAMALAITGQSSETTLESVLTAGASDLLFKPFRLEELRVRVSLAGDRMRIIQSLHSQRKALQAISSEMIHGLQQELMDAKTTTSPRPGAEKTS